MRVVTTKYFALVLNTRTVDSPFCVFREISEPGRDWRTEVYDPNAKEWRENMDFATYTVGGEIGAEPISKEKAEEIIARISRPAG